ncbi:MAG: glycoside hydrolase [Thiotrichales bacterium]
MSSEVTIAEPIAAQPRINVVLMWHMHQPEYRDLTQREYQLPWTYLHATKDYVDMAAHLENHPGARAVVNFAPILLEQLEDYARQIDGNLAHGAPLRDFLLNAVVSDAAFAIDTAARLRLLEACTKANEQRLIARFPAFEALVALARQFSRSGQVEYLHTQFFIDLVVWYHLAWMGETVRLSDPVIARLTRQGGHFTAADRRELLLVIGRQLASVVPRYRALAEAGQVELAMSPYAHPMLPLLLDFQSLREALPDAALPENAAYPDGEARARWHLDEGRKVFARCFGRAPTGIWPSEGGVSEPVVRLLDEYGFKWLATGDSVLRHSLARYSHQTPHGTLDPCHHVAYQLDASDALLFFRDDGLSDLIGFTYSNWHAEDAVGDLINHIHNIRAVCTEPDRRTVSIILDGENAWEYYPANGYYFLDALYRRLSADSLINLTTFDALRARKPVVRVLPGLVAGSWVYGNFATWMGDPFKNRAWDLLCDAKRALDAHWALNPAAREDRELLEQLAVCEGSDWFWWFGDYNPAQSVRDFDQLYRKNLRNLYRLIGQPAPEALDLPLSVGSHAATTEAGGVMRRGSE